MRVSIGLYPYERWGSVERMAEAVRLADRLGYFAISLPEHLVWPMTDGEEPLNKVWFDNFVLAASLAAGTEHVRFLFNACVVPYRHPVLLAKSVATLDVVSRGRVVLVAGTGWLRREFQALGVPFDRRGDRTDEALRAMKALWTGSSSYESEFVAIPPVHFAPRCVQEPHVPVWIGGNGRRPLRRAVELGDGWSPLGGTLEEVSEAIGVLRDGLEAVGRDDRGFAFGYVLPVGALGAASAATERHGRVECAASSVDEAVDRIGRAAEAGVNHVLVQIAWHEPSQYEDAIERFATEVMSSVSDGR